MQLETIKNSLFALSATEAARTIGGYVPPIDSGTFEDQDTFYQNGTIRTDKAEID